MRMIDKKEIQAAYKKEAGSLIKKIEEELTFLSGQRDANDERRLFRLFRYSHTLKGISGICRYYKVEEAAKSMEDIFRITKDKKRKINLKDKGLIGKKLNVCKRLLEKR